MTTTARILMTGLTCTIPLCTAGRAVAVQDGEPTIILHVVNHAGIGPEDLARAEDEATRIYAAARVRRPPSRVVHARRDPCDARGDGQPAR